MLIDFSMIDKPESHLQVPNKLVLSLPKSNPGKTIIWTGNWGCHNNQVFIYSNVMTFFLHTERHQEEALSKGLRTVIDIIQTAEYKSYFEIDILDRQNNIIFLGLAQTLNGA